MNDFLHFLNTASPATLTKIPGISQTLAENLIAARPFEAVNDCLHVRGMGKNLLARVQAAFEAIEPEIKETAMIPVEENDPMPIEKIQPVEAAPAQEAGPSFGARVGQVLLNVVRALLRLVLFVLVIGGIGALIYFGAPYLRETFIAPVEQNAARVSELENQVTTLQTQLTEIQSQLDQTNSRIDALDQSVAAHSASLEKLTAMQATLEAQLQASDDQALQALQHEIMLTRALDTLARARLYLAQSNFGLAKVDVQAAHDLLVELQTGTENAAFAQATARLDLALGNLPEFPVVASGDLEIAWQILMTGETVATATPEPVATTTTTPAPALDATATATATP